VDYVTTRNLLTDSQDFERGSWAKTNSTIADDVAQAPDGTLTADELVFSAVGGVGSSTARTYQGKSGLPSSTYTASVYVKAASSNLVYFRRVDNGTASGPVYDLSDGSYVTGTNAGCSLTSVGNGWWRFQSTLSSITDPIVYVANGSAVSTTGSVYIWGAQLEPGTTATDYVRTFDVVGKDYRWFEPTEGTVFVEGKSPLLASWTNPRFVSFSDGTSANRIETYLTQNSTVSVSAALSVFDTSVSQVLLTRTGTNADQFRKFSGTYKLNNFAVTTEGNSVATDTTGTVPDGITELEIGSAFSANNINGHIKRLTYWPVRQPDATLQVITQ